ncbi:MAG: hypothetical protein DMG04_18400 [Acidobacteria bacterium]|nr:MAG: hypothetical protein DMG04_18400 [Acidobacteriota bacterium]
MGIRPADRVLEVGVGTGINSSLYPRDCSVTGIDLSSSMLEKARDRIARKEVRNVRLLQIGVARAAHLAVHRPHRLQVGSRSARVSGAGGAEAGFDSEGERPADLVARDLHQRLNRGGAIV